LQERGFRCGAGSAGVDGTEDRRAHQRRTGRQSRDFDPDVVSTPCPFRIVMLGDAITTKKRDKQSAKNVEALDRLPAADPAGCGAT
jgi:Fe-S oxidoreductase